MSGAGFINRTRAIDYTILFTSPPHYLNTSRYKKLSFDAVKDFRPVTGSATPNWCWWCQKSSSFGSAGTDATDAFTARMTEEIPKWAKLAATAGVIPE